VIVAIKCMEKILPVHEAQLLIYLNPSEVKAGLIVNFYSQFIKEKIKELVLLTSVSSWFI